MKYIFVTGGVISSLGKGLTAAALGAAGSGRRDRYLTPGALPEAARVSFHLTVFGGLATVWDG